MNKEYGTLITEIGLAKITQAFTNDYKLELSNFVVGDGGGHYYKPTDTMTQLKNQVWMGSITSATINEENPNRLEILAIIGGEVGGFIIREMGILDSDGDLIAICNVPDTPKILITSGVLTELQIIMHIETSNVDNIQITTDSSVMIATKVDIENHNKSIVSHDVIFAPVRYHIENSDLHTTLKQTQSYDHAVKDLKNHIENIDIHVTVENKKRWDSTLSDHELRIKKIEDILFGQIINNPFIVKFDNLEGITLLKGIWNRTLEQIEC